MCILEEAFGGNLLQVLPCFLHHTQLSMGHYWNDAARLGSASPLPNVMDLIGIIDMCQWPLLPPLPSHYHDLVPIPPAPCNPDAEPNPHHHDRVDDEGGAPHL